MTALALFGLVLGATDSVLLVRSGDEHWAAFEERLVAELQASGFEVSEVAAPIDAAQGIPGQLEALCRSNGALAAMWFQPRPDGRVDAWVVDQATAKAVLRTYETPQSGAERARLALRAVELLHASLIEVRLMAPGEQAAVPQVARAAVQKRLGPEEQPHWTFGTGVGAGFSSDLRPQPMLELMLGYAFTPALAAEVQVASTVYPGTLDDGQGSSADIGLAFLRLLFVWSPLRAGPFAIGPALTLGGLLWWAAGNTEKNDLEPRTDATVALLAAAGLEVSLRINEGVRLQLLALGGASVPAVRVDLAGEPRAVLGRPLIDVFVRLEFE